MTLAGAHRLADVRAVERLFSGSPEISEAIYRLAQASRNGKASVEEVRLSPPLNNEGEAGWYKIKVRPLAFGIGRACLWSVADVHTRTGKAGKRLSGIAACHRFSRPCASRIFFLPPER